jgi:hypothetical protein
MELEDLQVGDLVVHRQTGPKQVARVTALGSEVREGVRLLWLATEDMMEAADWAYAANLQRMCRNCHRLKDQHHELTGKCLFGASTWA